MRTNVGLLNTGYYIGTTVAVFLIAVVSKVVPGTVMTRLTAKGDWRFSLATGFCMNCKGMIELVALNVGLNLNIISPRIFTMMVIMALLATFIVSPVIYALYEHSPPTVKTIDVDADTTSRTQQQPTAAKLSVRPDLLPSSSASELVSPTASSYVEMGSPKGGYGGKEGGLSVTQVQQVVRVHGEEEGEDK